MKLIVGCFGRIFDDMRQRKLMPLKLIFFVKASTLFVLYPYLTIHMRELGITIEETAIMNSITPFIAILMPPIAGLFADRIGNFKLMLSLFSAFGGAAALLLLVVPVARTNVQYPSTLVLATEGCSDDGNLIYGAYQNYPCDSISDANANLTLKSCGYSCPLGALNQTHVEDILSSRSYQLTVYNVGTESKATYDYAISESDMPQRTDAPQDPREIRKLENIEGYEIVIRRLSSEALFFPAHRPARPFGLECVVGRNSTACAFAPGSAATGRGQAVAVAFNASLRAIEPTALDEAEERRRYVAASVGCPSDGGVPTESAGVEVHLADGVAALQRCSRSCVFTAPREDVCSNAKFVVEHNPRLTFWTYLAVRVFIGVISGTTFPMFEGAVIAIIREHKADYGLQRIYGSIGGMISSPLSGLLIDYASRGKSYADLRPAFYLYFALKLFTSFLMTLIDLQFKAPSSKVVSEVRTVLRNVEVVALLIATSVLGIAWGYIESFLFWFLEDLGASRSLMGMTVTVGGIAGVPLLILSGPIIDKIGHANVIFAGFVCYAIRLLGGSYTRLSLYFRTSGAARSGASQHPKSADTP
ncbi:uncharacterized protein LOC131670894 isoform X2 [Phymastichus coffea]|uniref:uncharacterized protein LOC131670894 isoform X2 n=1 Tax=Phymastichus coffea TaxID=108790 RepID=UPI00273CF045|nr:uncharacterized protein LOC131670894 isoform X2 [Phymastichus coffea]